MDIYVSFYSRIRTENWKITDTLCHCVHFDTSQLCVLYQPFPKTPLVFSCHLELTAALSTSYHLSSSLCTGWQVLALPLSPPGATSSHTPLQHLSEWSTSCSGSSSLRLPERTSVLVFWLSWLVAHFRNCYSPAVPPNAAQQLSGLLLCTSIIYKWPQWMWREGKRSQTFWPHLPQCSHCHTYFMLAKKNLLEACIKLQRRVTKGKHNSWHHSNVQKKTFFRLLITEPMDFYSLFKW